MWRSAKTIALNTTLQLLVIYRYIIIIIIMDNFNENE